MTQHTAECRERNAQYKATRDAWVKQWPNYCRPCNGTGIGSYSPSTYWEPECVEACEQCLGHDCYERDEAGNLVYTEVVPGMTEGPYKPALVTLPDPRCPRCFGPIITRDEDGPCAVCGWNHNDGLPLADDECMGDCMPEPTTLEDALFLVEGE
jgi:hypothetical protein